ncbi:hypothetical protein F5144DRAFT_634097 [Chaetomium tenue]|uniref:Uncharacterized protein n=1 Tax=Chaetomium tenue TaxID=1854479 RepID=A0ACB7NUG3_9PEZI|nr:hypothetical protein F5144DRAFT_634097 [Chaetomium globosum]
MKSQQTSTSLHKTAPDIPTRPPPFTPENELIHWQTPPPPSPPSPTTTPTSTPTPPPTPSTTTTPPLLTTLPTIFLDPTTSQLLPTTPHLQTFLHTDLSLTRLDTVYAHLWWAGRQFPARPLHRQVHELGRAIAPTSRADLHLVWCPRSRRLFVKPLPAYLLSCGFWEGWVSGSGGDGELDACARGFLVSYVWLVRDELDWVVAREARLLPEGVSWERWRGFVEGLVAGGGLDVNGLVGVHRRFHYGELRVNRLDHLCWVRLGTLSSGLQVLRGYSGFLPPSYSDFFRKRFGWIILTFAFCNTVLSALQVGLATDSLQPLKTIQDVSSGIVIFSLVVLVATLVVPFVLYIGLFSYFLVKTLADTAMREQKRRIWAGETTSGGG